MYKVKGLMKLEKRKAVLIGVFSLLIASGFQIFNDLACYNKSMVEIITGFWFPAIPLLPGLIALFSRNPLRAVGAPIAVVPFYLFAYYVDCVQPYQGGGASMIYAGVILYGLPLSIFTVWLTGYICEKKNIEIC